MAAAIEPVSIGDSTADGIIVPELAGEGHASLIVIRCRRGFLMCGYLRLEQAEQLGDVAVRVAGGSFDAVLANKVTGLTPQAAALVITPVKTGMQAAEILNR